MLEYTMKIEEPHAEQQEPVMEVGEATSQDAEAIARIHRATFEATYPKFPKLHSAEQDLEHFKNLLERSRILVAKQNGEFAAYCAFGNGWLTDLYVAPEYQDQGLGTLLLNKAKDESSELQLWTFQENQSARRFYEHNGFVPAEETDGHANEEKQPDIRYVWRKQ